MAITAPFDRPVYNPGDQMTLTVVTGPTDRDQYAETPVQVRVSVAGVGEADVSAVLRQPAADTAVVVVDQARDWTLTSDDGVTAVFTATA